MQKEDTIIDLRNTKDNSDTETYVFEELETLSQKVKSTAGMPQDLTERLTQMLDRLNRMAKLGHYAQEFDTLARYIEVAASIPWEGRTDDRLELGEVKGILDKNHYGMETVKDRMLEYLATMKLIQDRGGDAIARSPVLLLVGLQGIGKTTLAISVAEALGRKFHRIALGAIGSVLELRGRSKVYPEAEPGQIIKALIKTGVRNPVILLDEIEKASGEAGLRSDVMATLLEILDPNQNPEFRDHYVDYPVDLSDVLFICSANNTGTISTALMDRMEVIKMPSYTDAEKIAIARDYLMPKIFANTGLREGELIIDDKLWPGIVRPFGFDSGIRSLGRTLESICRKVAKEVVEGKSTSVNLTEDNLKYYLPK
ncbi:MAG: Lon protease [candidate division WWE3 bacterium GW2011_GWC1_41_7]|uniref:Lon protease n=3 Tax=Katanobacteria TaxID=422282 RepID=A0A0G0XCI6_UNCKA|nr:MAG: Lon protease [candidate division WWE3 bacterium GW2011_GWB1_41_6]KKS18829.1 MAG: Lon protease [candidate division WWE3 bacterium GW2011_GWC1_41_7]KKS22585.1 MAG: Lon protease [candidate division WWE3 bacterium GW2011_GWA1_41_8]